MKKIRLTAIPIANPIFYRNRKNTTPKMIVRFAYPPSHIMAMEDFLLSRQSRKVELIADKAIEVDGQAAKRVACATRILVKIAMRVDGESEMKTIDKPVAHKAALVDYAETMLTNFGNAIE